MTRDYPHIPNSFDTITPISEDMRGVPPVSRTPREWALSRLEGVQFGRTREISEEDKTQVQ